MDIAIVLGVLNIVLINLILSGDNAVVIAMAAMGLPEKLRKSAIFWGASLAVVLRILLTFIAALLLKIPLVQAIGGILLSIIAIKLLKPSDEHATESQGSSNFFKALLTILYADFIMSLDNVLAVAGAAKGNLYMLVFGLAISIPFVLAGSTLLTKLMDRFRWLTWLGAGIIAYTAGEMIVKDKFLEHDVNLLPYGEVIIPVVTVASVFIMAKITRSRQLAPDVISLDEKRLLDKNQKNAG